MPQSGLLAVGLALAAVLLVAIAIATTISAQHATTAKDESQKNSAEATQSVVKLSGEKLRTAQLHTSACETRELAQVRTVPGKIIYNESRRLEIKAPVAGVVQQVFVSQEQAVKKGDRLVVVSSREIGLARDEVNQCKADLAIAKKEEDWAAQIAVNLDELFAFLKEHPEPAAIEKRFDNKVLGEYREKILTTYSKLVLAEKVAAETRPLEEKGSISGRLAEERRSNQQVAAAAFASAGEQSKFEAGQARDKRLANAQHAQRILDICRQRLEALTGKTEDAQESAYETLSELVLLAPFDGVITERMAVDAAHIAAGEPLFVLADTRTLWISAELSERDWNAIETARQSDLLVRVPSLQQDQVTAHVKFTEGKISPETRTVSLVGELNNSQEQFRPGMFAWVSVAVGKPRTVLAVPSSAIVRHEQTPFVFVTEGPETFRRVDVQLGLETPDWVEITSGLTVGQQVVDQGAFYLKSELLLEREAE